jgi:hypothetical protein
VVPTAIARSPLTIVEIIRSGISGLPPVLWANHYGHTDEHQPGEHAADRASQ